MIKRALFLLPLICATSAFGQKGSWRLTLDSLIRENLSVGKVHISYISLSNSLDQYHRNANQPVPSVDIIKLPIWWEALRLHSGLLSAKDGAAITPEQAISASGYFGPADAGKSHSWPVLMEASVLHNDLLATNLVIDFAKPDILSNALKARGFGSLMLNAPLTSPAVALHKSSLISTAAFSSYLKKWYAESSSRPKNWLHTQVANRREVTNFYALNGSDFWGLAESTPWARGVAGILPGKDNGGIWCIMITDFADSAAADEVMNRITEAVKKIRQE